MAWNYLSIPKLQRWKLSSLGMDKYFPPYFTTDVISFSKPVLKSIHVTKRGHWWRFIRQAKHTLAAWWRHYMETLFTHAICDLNPPVTGGIPSLETAGLWFLLTSSSCWQQGHSTLDSTLLVRCDGNTPVVSGSPLFKGLVLQKVFPCHDVIMASRF